MKRGKTEDRSGGQDRTEQYKRQEKTVEEERDVVWCAGEGWLRMGCGGVEIG